MLFSQGVPSRYKTATFKHRPPVEKPHIIAVPPKNKLYAKCSSGVIQNSPMVSPYTEEKVVTMVEIENEKNKENDAEDDGEGGHVKRLVDELVNKVASDGKVS